MTADHGVRKPAPEDRRTKLKTDALPFSTEHKEIHAVDIQLRFTRNHRRRMWLLMFGADLLGFALAIAGVLMLNSFFHFFTPNLDDLKYMVVLLLCMGFFASSRLHSGVGINPADEIRLVTQYISLSIMIGLVIFTVFEVGWVTNAFVFGLAWLGSILAVLLSRWSIRVIAARLGLWGEPIIVAGKGIEVKEVVKFFKHRRRLGFIPVGSTIKHVKPNSMPTISLAKLETLPDGYYRERGINTVVVTSLLFSSLSGVTAAKLYKLFQNVVFVSNTNLFEGTSIRVNDYEGLLALEARQNFLSPVALLLKRSLDIGLGALLSALLLPVGLLVGFLIKLEGRGPILFTQERVGRDGELFRMLKFGTMVTDADAALKKYLDGDQKALDEWRRHQKLKFDPRVTRVGKFLRKWSLDEIPQLVNVIKGDMSLVGPRPMIGNQVELYGERIGVYYGMRPGMSGLWQVSGRNKTTFEERANFDVYYVRNWSIWLDLYILLRTVWVVINRNGAY